MVGALRKFARFMQHRLYYIYRSWFSFLFISNFEASKMAATFTSYNVFTSTICDEILLTRIYEDRRQTV
jgi:hypothetical protein